MNSGAAEHDFRHLDPLTGISVLLLLLGFLLLTEVSPVSVDDWGVVTAAVGLFIIAMIRQAHRHAIDQGFSRNALREAFGGRESARPDVDLTMRLVQLNDLRIMGALTEDEFEAVKATLLIPKTRD